MQKNDQGKQAFLGILACLLGSQYDMHWNARFNFKSLGKLLSNDKLRICFKFTGKGK